jgi:hypothetical protein
LALLAERGPRRDLLWCAGWLGAADHARLLRLVSAIERTNAGAILVLTGGW